MTPAAEIITGDSEIVEASAATDEASHSEATTETVTDSRVALQAGLDELRALNKLSAVEDLNVDMKRALAGTAEIGEWNTAYLEKTSLMKKAGHK